MPIYNVHVYREMRVKFDGIEAATPGEAAAIAGSRTLEVSDDFDECDGETFAALVDLEGDADFAQSVLIDFDCERLRKAAPQLLEALRLWTSGASIDEFDQVARAAIALATGSRKEMQP